MAKVGYVTPAGIEPASSESESEILSIVLRSHVNLCKNTETQTDCQRTNVNWQYCKLGFIGISAH
jgi:hypothetical protein